MALSIFNIKPSKWPKTKWLPKNLYFIITSFLIEIQRWSWALFRCFWEWLWGMKCKQLKFSWIIFQQIMNIIWI
jgi:hypothetical protein